MFEGGVWTFEGKRRTSSNRRGYRLSRRCDCPLNVTRAFSEEQVRLVALKRERILYELIGILKFDCAPVIIRGRVSPSVALW